MKKSILNHRGYKLSKSELSKEDLIKHLRKAKNLLFLYENNRGKREQISGVFEYAISTKKNIYISNCSMFRHVLYYEPKKLRVETLIINKNNTQKLNYETILDEWSTENFRWYFDQAINKVIKSYKIEGKPTTINIYKKKLRVLAKKILEKVGAYQPRTQNYYYDINNFSENFPKLNINNQEFNNCINADDIKLYKNEIDFFNKVCPELVAKKNYQALSQYAILLRLMQKTQKDILNIKILCVGAYEDVVATSLKRIGIYVEEVDPNLNYNLEDFIKKPSQKNMKYDLIYSISVLEHIFDDINILKICEQKLKKGGHAVACVGIIRKEGSQMVAWFEDGENGVKSVLPGFINSFDTVYAMTIHKSQGSEYNEVLVVLPKDKQNNILTRELFYTAVTRAKTKVIIQATKEVAEYTTGERVQRVSGICNRFNQI
jgi:hypothetical protein